MFFYDRNYGNFFNFFVNFLKVLILREELSNYHQTLPINLTNSSRTSRLKEMMKNFSITTSFQF
jgi:hypothetical protein